MAHFESNRSPMVARPAARGRGAAGGQLSATGTAVAAPCRVCTGRGSYRRSRTTLSGTHIDLVICRGCGGSGTDQAPVIRRFAAELAVIADGIGQTLASDGDRQHCLEDVEARLADLIVRTGAAA